GSGFAPDPVWVGLPGSDAPDFDGMGATASCCRNGATTGCGFGRCSCRSFASEDRYICHTCSYSSFLPSPSFLINQLTMAPALSFPTSLSARVYALGLMPGRSRASCASGEKDSRVGPELCTAARAFKNCCHTFS